MVRTYCACLCIYGLHDAEGRRPDLLLSAGSGKGRPVFGGDRGACASVERRVLP
jgi:hypothetical protein